ncbi:MAG TPA: nucleotide exchange factor GrpE [Nostocaceae cyanobacterium]|nr:nucleotide exchange factor GrpE [Nostocaceae cyanobacterium]
MLKGYLSNYQRNLTLTAGLFFLVLAIVVIIPIIIGRPITIKPSLNLNIVVAIIFLALAFFCISTIFISQSKLIKILETAESMKNEEDKIQGAVTLFLKEVIKEAIGDVKQEIKEEFEVLKELRDNLQKNLRQSVKEASVIEQNTEAAKTLKHSIDDTKKLIDELLIQQLQEMKQQLQEIRAGRQEQGNLRREIESWQNSAIDFLSVLETTITLPGLHPEYQKAVEKLTTTFSKTVEKQGIQIIRPNSNDEFDYIQHIAQEEESQTVTPGNIIRCEAWGYKINGKVVQAAKVIVAKAPISSVENLAENKNIIDTLETTEIYTNNSATAPIEDASTDSDNSENQLSRDSSNNSETATKFNESENQLSGGSSDSATSPLEDSSTDSNESENQLSGGSSDSATSLEKNSYTNSDESKNNPTKILSNAEKYSIDTKQKIE